MSADMPAEKRFKILTQITRASHFAWRKAVAETCGDIDPEDVVYKMWEITGVETGNAYLKHLDPEKPLPKQIADSIAWSSQSMGEEAETIEGETEKEAFLKHSACPWFVWHERLGLLAEDRPGCDIWFEKTIDTINARLGTNIRVETEESLPEGGSCCLRRIWEE